jgi:aryl-alcohol dehydrogenase-like predicted oxidoreductase
MDSIKHIGFGCVALSTFTTQNAALRILETAYDHGITHFDTAPIYGNGFSEKVLSVFLKNKREKISLATKVGLFPNGTTKLPVWAALPLNAISKKIKGKTKEQKITFSHPQILPVRPIEKSQIQDSLANSMDRIGVNYFDYVLLHEALPHFLSTEALDYLFDLKLQGTIGKLGIAASSVNIETLTNSEIKRWDVLQYENAIQYNSDSLINTFEEKEHIYHSIFKTLLLVKKEKIDISEAPGILMARSYLNNPNGKILFSTTSISNLKSNLRVYEAYAKFPKEEVEKIVRDAIS